MSMRGRHATGPSWDRMDLGLRERIAGEKIGLLAVDYSGHRWSQIPYILRPLLTEAVQEYKRDHGKVPLDPRGVTTL